MPTRLMKGKSITNLPVYLPVDEGSLPHATISDKYNLEHPGRAVQKRLILQGGCDHLALLSLMSISKLITLVILHL